ncbi:diguanylate cyclase [Marinicella sp. S1101]|uniref:tetratricopeptide repeat-containing diguanylate cyclase n=1 Tax=Marinicella marina TaxID=2996016 RepID=UPI002260937C|nr:tetratricopeptide repeat-containing diguanylate cyclase [Marinicella marina]MCX7554711.1 diguanylate cyclase [Marinicella marina]MDJ1141473.1 diguanylate cyclase [Marinicella marina]
MTVISPLCASENIQFENLNALAYEAPDQLLAKVDAMEVSKYDIETLRHIEVIKAKALYYLNRFAESQTVLIAVEAAFDEIEDNRIKELTMRLMGQNFYRMGGFDQAMSYALKAKIISEDNGLTAAQAQVTNMIAAIHLRSGEHQLALNFFTEALANFKAIKSMNDIAKVNNNLAAVHIELKQYPQAEEYLKSALQLSIELNRPTTYMSATVNKIELLVDTNKFDEAAETYAACLAYASEESLKSYLVWCLEAGAYMLKQQGDFEESISVTQRAYLMAAEQGLSQSQLNLGKALIELYQSTNQYEKALTVSAENLQQVESINAEILTLKLDEVRALNDVEQTRNQLQFERQQNKLYLANQRLTMAGLAVLIIMLLVALYLLRSKKQVLSALHQQQHHTQDALEAMREAKEANEKLAKTDALTGLYNRREMMNLMNSAINSTTKNEQQHAVMLDVDWFKQINDEYGHAMGDQVLIELSKTMLAWLPKGACCARWGGEEFLIMLVELSGQEAKVLIEDLLQKINDITIDSHPELSITASAGLSPYQVWTSIDAWLDEADAALYSSKSNGRNQLTISQ